MQGAAGFFHGGHAIAGQDGLSHVGQQIAEAVAVFGVFYGAEGGAEETHLVVFQDASLG